MLDVIILSGAQPGKNLDVPCNKALYSINGKTMIQYVIDALKNAKDINRIVVVGPGRELEGSLAGKVDAVVDSNGSIMDNIAAGIDYLGLDRHIVICSSDIPMLTPAAVDDFTKRCMELKADICYPIVEKSVNEDKYPGSKRTYVKISEGIFTGGNIFYINPKIVKKGFALAESLLEARKKPLKMARIMGIGFMLRLITGNLSIKTIEDKLSEILNIKGRAVISKFAEIGNDVDKPSDVEIAQKYLPM